MAAFVPVPFVTTLASMARIAAAVSSTRHGGRRRGRRSLLAVGADGGLDERGLHELPPLATTLKASSICSALTATPEPIGIEPIDVPTSPRGRA
jgi:hypothetical protein